MTKKKKIAFVANCCIVGGVETALINLLRVIDTEKYDITLFTNFAGNPVIHNVPNYIKCIDLDTYGIKSTYKWALKNHRYHLALSVLKNYVFFRLIGNCAYKEILLYKHIGFTEAMFDCVIAYKCGISTAFLAKNAIQSKQSILWVHGALPMPDRKYLKILCSYDKCFCVSEYTQDFFLQHCPSMKDRTEIFHNILDANAIVEKAKESVNDIITDRKWIFATVGRLGQSKGQSIIPKVAYQLTNAGIDFAWYLVGDGPLRGEIEKNIAENRMEGNVFLLGTKANPYPYIKASTIYVQTSTSEGWCLTTQEARILHKPCVVTDIPVMHEQFIDGKNGIIAEGTDSISLYNGIMRLIKSSALYDEIVENLVRSPQNGTMELRKLYDILDK